MVFRLILTASSCVALGGCQAHDPAKDAFAADLATCARTAPTVEESGHCRAEVERRYAPLWDGGAR
jgi:hypothetical protein